jgi:hypothetical protein
MLIIDRQASLLRTKVRAVETGVPKEWRLTTNNDDGSPEPIEFIAKLQGVIWIKELPLVLLYVFQTKSLIRCLGAYYPAFPQLA